MVPALDNIARTPEVRDPHRFINELGADALDRIVNRLESRGKDEVFARLFDAYASKLDLTGAPRILEIGCGTGVITRALAQTPNFDGQIIGADQSLTLLAHARLLAEQTGLRDKLSYESQDAHALTFDDESFDIVIAHTLISHVTNPQKVLQEMARVVRPGGTVVVFDGDYASLTYAYPDEVLGRQMDHALSAATFNNRIIMRTLPQLFTQVGLRLDDTIAELVSEIGTGSFFRSFAETYAPNVKSAGLLSNAEVDHWMAEQTNAMEDGTFFAACSYYSYLARRDV